MTFFAKPASTALHSCTASTRIFSPASWSPWPGRSKPSFPRSSTYPSRCWAPTPVIIKIKTGPYTSRNVETGSKGSPQKREQGLTIRGSRICTKDETQTPCHGLDFKDATIRSPGMSGDGLDINHVDRVSLLTLSSCGSLVERTKAEHRQLHERAKSNIE